MIGGIKWIGECRIQETRLDPTGVTQETRLDPNGRSLVIPLEEM